MKYRFTFLQTIQGEPSLADLLEDPVLHRVLARDALTVRDVVAACRDGQERLARTRALNCLPRDLVIWAGWTGHAELAMPAWPGVGGL